MDHMVRWTASLVVMLLSAVACDLGLRLPTTVPDNVELSVLIGPPDKGYVEIDGAIITSGVGVPFPGGKLVNLVAKSSDTGWEFARWERDLAGINAEETILMDGSKVVRAVFAPVSLVTTTVRPGTLAKLELQPGDLALTPNESKRVLVIATDQSGDRIEGLTFEWTASEGGSVRDGVFTAGAVAGHFPSTLEVRATYGTVTLKASASVTVEPGPLDHVTIEPVAIEAGGEALLVAQAFDRYGNPVSGLTYAFGADPEVGELDAEGRFTSTRAGFYAEVVTVKVAQGGVAVAAAASAAVEPGPLDHVTIEPDFPTMEVGQEQQFTVSAFDQYGNRITGLPNTFAVRQEVGIIDEQGRFTARTAGTYEGGISVNVSQSGVTEAASAGVTIEPRLLFWVDDSFVDRGGLGVYELTFEGASRLVILNENIGATLFGLVDIALDREGRIYLLDRDNLRILRATHSGELTPVVEDLPLRGPVALAVTHEGDFLVGDNLENVVVKIRPEGEITTIVSLAGTSTGAQGLAIAIAENGDYVIINSPSTLRQLLRVAPSGEVTRVIQDVPALEDRFTAVAIAPADHPLGAGYFVTAFRKLFHVTLEGDMTTIAEGFSGNLADLTVGPSGDLFVLENFTRTIHRMSPDGAVEVFARGAPFVFPGDLVMFLQSSLPE